MGALLKIYTCIFVQFLSNFSCGKTVWMRLKASPALKGLISIKKAVSIIIDLLIFVGYQRQQLHERTFAFVHCWDVLHPLYDSTTFWPLLYYDTGPAMPLQILNTVGTADHILSVNQPGVKSDVSIKNTFHSKMSKIICNKTRFTI